MQPTWTHGGCRQRFSVYAGQTACRQPAPVRFELPASPNSKARPRRPTSPFLAHFEVLSPARTPTQSPARHRGGQRPDSQSFRRCRPANTKPSLPRPCAVLNATPPGPRSLRPNLRPPSMPTSHPSAVRQATRLRPRSRPTWTAHRAARPCRAGPLAPQAESSSRSPTDKWSTTRQPHQVLSLIHI